MILLVSRTVAFIFLSIAGSALAVDGVIEINQAKAIAGQVTPGDSPGYPVSLSQAGSYKLTSDLIVPTGTNGILLGAHDIYFDLNGFAIRGPASCAPISCPTGTAAGISAPDFFSGGARATVVDGKVGGFEGDCINLGGNAHVERVVIQNCGGEGIQLLGSGIVIANRVSITGGTGLALNGSIFRDNYIFSNGLVAGTGGVSVKDGKAIGGNYCSDGRCTLRGEKRYYVTKSLGYTGATATLACDAGFHMASLYELHDTTSLSYDSQLGETVGSDGGVPRTLDGWVRTGSFPATINQSGISNCNGWTSSNPADWGSAAIPNFEWDNSSTAQMAPWNGFTRSCGGTGRVWCVED